MDISDPLLSELCSICHINPPKYRCPRCSTRTCSLPCTRRHKLWSQCSGVRDPAAYLKRSELASEAAFDRDFNFITGIERSLERAERDVENRGIELARGQALQSEEGQDDASSGAGAGRKRKHPGQGLVKGEAGFLRGAEAGRVKVLRAPRGMSRNKQNTSRWHPKHKCLSWTVEWVSATGERTIRNALETYPISEAYDRAIPLPKHERPSTNLQKAREDSQENTSTEQAPTSTETPDGSAPTTATTTTEPTGPEPTTPSDPGNIKPSMAPTEEQDPKLPITPHRNLYFYLHRPRTTTKQPVLVPLPPLANLGSVLRERTVLEFPTIYALPGSPETILASNETFPYILEEEYLRTATPEELGEKTTESELQGTGTGSRDDAGGVDLKDLDEKKVMEVLKQDLFESVS